MFNNFSVPLLGKTNPRGNGIRDVVHASKKYEHYGTMQIKNGYFASTQTPIKRIVHKYK